MHAFLLRCNLLHLHVCYQLFAYSLDQITNIHNYHIAEDRAITHFGVTVRRYRHALQWHHNMHDGFSNHQPHDCFLNRLFRHRSKKIANIRVTGLFAENSPATGEFPAQMTSNAEIVSIWWHHHVDEQATGRAVASAATERAFMS